MIKIKQYFSNWDFFRFFRLGLGIFFAFLYVGQGETLYLGISVFLLVQTVMNIGCGCTTNNCSVSTNNPTEKKTDYQINELNRTKNDV